MRNLNTHNRSLWLFLALFPLSLVGTRDLRAQGASSYEKSRGQMMLDQVRGDIKSSYYDPDFHGINLETNFKEASEKIKNAQSPGQVMGIIAQAVLNLNDSHTFFIPPQRQADTDYGLDLQAIGDDVYVVKVKEKSDAEAKGIKVGDFVHLIDGYQPVRANLWKLVYLYYALRPQPGMHIAVSSPGGEPRQMDIIAKVTDRKRIDLTSYVDFMDLVRESENEESKRKKSHRLQELGDLLIWKMPSFNLSADEVDALMDKARAHKKLILDLRGNSGGYEETLLRMIGNLFDHDIKVGDIQRRKESKALTAKSRGEKTFNGQLIVLVDSVSASSAEILAKVVQVEKRGTIIGDHTAGAVMRARVYQHEVGVTSAAFFALSVTDADVKMTDGKTLEGTGVMPDTIMLPTGADLAAKGDPVLAYAAKLVGVSIDAAKAGALFPPIKEKP
ncbi:MAG TPA: S41 family peptidase [Pyrinomonadaceae bacterium]|nr:S41 family peptidase [Pyrinomonadaceae bacterium]